MTSNSLAISLALALKNMGIAFIPDRQAKPYVDTGELVELFDGQWYEDNVWYIMYKQSPNTPLRFRFFIEKLDEFIRNERWEQT